MNTKHHRWSAMGTVFEAFLVGDDNAHLRNVADAIEDEVRRLEALLSRFDPTSEVSRLNREAGERAVRVGVELWELLLQCENARELLRGCFDITAGSITASPATRILMDADHRTIRYSSTNVRLDLGGVGKGYALDRSAELMRQYGVCQGLLNAGSSSVLAIGNDPWPLDVRDPNCDDLPPIGRIQLVDQGFSCSATRHPGQSISDIREPSTSEPLLGAVACVVLAPTATEAEMLSTGLLVMGREQIFRRWLGEMWPAVRVAWIDAQNESAQLDWLTEAP